jgi:hypothetical protein
MEQSLFDTYIKQYYTEKGRASDFEEKNPFQYVLTGGDLIHAFDFASDPPYLILTSFINEPIDMGENMDKMIDWVNTKTLMGECSKEGNTVKIVSKSIMPDTMDYNDTCSLGIERLIKNNEDLRDDLLN